MRPASLLTTVLLLGACAGASTQTPASAPDPIDVPTEKTVSAPSAPPPSPIPPPADSERRDYPRRPGTPQPTRTAPGAKEPEADASNLPDYPRRISVARPRDFGDEIAAFELTDSLDPQPPGGTLFVGSSTIRLWEGLDESFPGIHVIPRGFGGSQLDDVLHYAPRIVIPYRPRLIVLYAGDNDLAAGRSPTEIFRDFQAFIELVWQTLPTARIAFISINAGDECDDSTFRRQRSTASVRGRLQPNARSGWAATGGVVHAGQAPHERARLRSLEGHSGAVRPIGGSLGRGIRAEPRILNQEK